MREMSSQSDQRSPCLRCFHIQENQKHPFYAKRYLEIRKSQHPNKVLVDRDTFYLHRLLRIQSKPRCESKF